MRELVVEKMKKNLYAADREAQSKNKRTANSWFSYQRVSEVATIIV